MSQDWSGNWYRDEEPGQPGAGPQGSPTGRAQPSFIPNQGGSAPDDKRENAWGSGAYGAGASGSAWPMQPPDRSRRPGSGGPMGPAGPRGPRGSRGWRRWLRPRRILAILAALVALAVVATVAVYFSVNSKLTRINVLVPTSLTSAGTNWLIAGSDSRGGLTAAQENQLALGRDITGGR
jgi:hypothetical protein